METKHMKLLSMIAAAASLCSCSDGDDPVLTQKDWSTTEFFSPTDELRRPLSISRQWDMSPTRCRFTTR